MRIRFGQGPGTRHGPWDFCHLSTMCVKGSCAEKAYQMLKARSRSTALPSGRYLLGKIRSMRYDWMKMHCNHALRRSVLRARRRGMLRRPVNVVTNFHKIGRYEAVKLL